MIEGPRSLRPQEHDTLLELVDTVFMTSRGWSPAMADLYPLLYKNGDCEHKHVMVDNGRVVAHIGACLWDVVIHGHRVPTGSIGGVACYEEYRGRGYATQALTRCFKHLREAGACVAYISGGRGLYLRNQCVKAGCEFRPTVSADAWPRAIERGWEVRVAAPDDLDALIGLHQREPLRHVRPRRVFETAAFISTEQPNPRWRQTVYGIWQGDEMAAYAALRRNTGAEGGAHVREVAGSREALVAAMPGLLAAADAEQMQIPVRPGDHELVRLLAANAVACTPTTSAGTWRVLDFAGLMDALRPWVDERCDAELAWEGERDHGAFVQGRERLELTDAILAGEVLFGGEERLDPRVLGAPPGLRRALSRVLPVPAPLSGLNSV